MTTLLFVVQRYEEQPDSEKPLTGPLLRIHELALSVGWPDVLVAYSEAMQEAA